jgi:hypothetical protein
MIVNVRIDIDDAQRNALSVLLNPAAPKRLATRLEVNSFVCGIIDGVCKTVPPMAADETPRTRSLSDTVARARAEDPEALRGKSDGFVLGWCKVKYAAERKT